MAPKSFKSFSNLAISLDGKIADPAHPSKMLGTALDRKTMQVIRARADVVVFGASTLKAAQKPIKKIVNAVISASGDLPADLPFWDDPKVIRFVFTTARGYARVVESSRGRAFVVLAGQSEIDPEKVFQRLLDSDLTRILVEGGGETLALFLGASLVQEMHVTLTPRLIGGRSSPTLVGGDGVLSPWGSLQLLKTKRVRDEVYLHYRVKGAKTKV
jgi:riboflavin-specific deaminase-like protein